MAKDSSHLLTLARVEAQYPEFLEYLRGLDLDLSAKSVDEEDTVKLHRSNGARKILSQIIKDLTNAKTDIEKIKANTIKGSP